MLIYSKLLCNLVNSLTNGVQLCGLAVHLVCSRVQEQLSVSYTSELGVSLLSWVTEVLNFSHCELPTNKNMFKTNMFQNMTSITILQVNSTVHYKTVKLWQTSQPPICAVILT